MTASGSGFTPGELIELKRDGAVVATVAAGADGTFAVRVDIAGVQNGEHTITAAGTLSGFTATENFSIEAQVCLVDHGKHQRNAADHHHQHHDRGLAGCHWFPDRACAGGQHACDPAGDHADDRDP